ncbi:MAG: hypothetical protein LBL21_03215 [Rickettsiales bacterium]|jgi:predicted  nucleic acid-binding Zn-ribbon protein|nr:hypothetical protein [Rickettsiales bacterium]
MNFEQILAVVMAEPIERGSGVTARFKLKDFTVSDGKVLDRDDSRIGRDYADRYKFSTTEKRLLLQIFDAAENKSEDGEAFIRTISLVADGLEATLSNGNANKKMLFLKKLGDISDEKLKKAALDRLIGAKSSFDKMTVDMNKFYSNAVTMRAGRAGAGARDLYDLLSVTEDFRKALGIAGDVGRAAEAEIADELKKDAPDIDRIEESAHAPLMAANDVFERVRSLNDEVKEFKAQKEAARDLKNQMLEKFDLAKIMAGGAEYFPKYSESLESRMQELSVRAKALEAENDGMKSKIDVLEYQNKELDAALKQERGESEKLRAEIASLRTGISAAERANGDKLRKIKAAAEKLKMGLGGKGLPELQEAVNAGRA